MQRAMPQLSETEMGFDFHNPVASVHHSPLTRVLTEQECTVTPSNLSTLCHCDNKEKGFSNFHTCSCCLKVPNKDDAEYKHVVFDIIKSPKLIFKH